MWYVIQTITGKEEELAGSIDRVLHGQGYKKCFVIHQECVWRIEGSYKTYIRPLFPSYVFAETENPEEFFLSLKRVPQFSRLLGNEGMFWTVREEERKLLCRMMEAGGDGAEQSQKKNGEGQGRGRNDEEKDRGRNDEEKDRGRKGREYLIRRSKVQVNDKGEIIAADGFLKNYLDRIVKKRLRKRSVTIEIPFLGEMRRIQVGIRVEGEKERR